MSDKNTVQYCWYRGLCKHTE